MKRVYAAILDVENFDEAKWIHATLLRRMGGLGLRDPTRVIHTARLASLTNTADLARQLGALEEYTKLQTEAAVADYMAAVQSILRPELFPSKDLQKTLTQVLHDQALNRLINISDEPTKQKLNSLTTPHATAWTTISPLVKTLTPVESRAALRWVSGVPFRPRQYMCPHCGAKADPYGLHAITCTRSGAISRGHNILRDTVAELFNMARVPVDIEQTLAECFERPADILVSRWGGKQLAIDFTVVTPTRPSSHLTSSSTTTLMDHAAAQKLRKSKEKCQVAGWHFMPFVADCYGALRCDARTFIWRFIHRYSDLLFPLNETEAGKAI